MTVILFICSLAVAAEDCGEATQLRHYDLPFKPVVCGFNTQTALMDHANLWNPFTEQAVLTCRQAART